MPEPLRRAAVLALIVTATGYAVETARLSGAQGADGTIVELQRRGAACGTCDAYQMVIEYVTPSGAQRFTSSRAIWDTWGEMNRTGTSLPVLYDAEGRAWVDALVYTHPFTSSLLILDGLLIAAALWISKHKGKLRTEQEPGRRADGHRRPVR